MSTTVTLDEDIYQSIRDICIKRNLSFKQVMNEAIARGIDEIERPRSFRVEPLDLGRCLLPNLDNTQQVLDYAEGEDRKG